MSEAKKALRSFGSHGYTIHPSQHKPGWIFTQWSKELGTRTGMSMFIPFSERFPENVTWRDPATRKEPSITDPRLCAPAPELWGAWDKAAELADFAWYAFGSLASAQRRESGIRLLRAGVIVSLSPWQETDRTKDSEGETKCP